MKSLRQVLGRQPYRLPRNPNREAIQKGKNQGAKRNLIPLTGLKLPRSGDGVWG